MYDSILFICLLHSVLLSTMLPNDVNSYLWSARVVQTLLHDLVQADVGPEDAVRAVVQIHGDNIGRLSSHVPRVDQRKGVQREGCVSEIYLDNPLPLSDQPERLVLSCQL